MLMPADTLANSPPCAARRRCRSRGEIELVRFDGERDEFAERPGRDVVGDDKQFGNLDDLRQQFQVLVHVVAASSRKAPGVIASGPALEMPRV